MDFVYREINIPGYESVIEIKEKRSSLHAIIALHNTKLGCALGGTRAYPYASFEEGLTDVLRLSEGMTYKSAVARTGTGGGKSVIFLNSSQEKTEEMLMAFGEAVNSFKGRYICAEDVGISPDELAIINRTTPHAVGLPTKQSSGDPSRFTARGGFQGMRALATALYGSPDLRDKVIAIQGLGSVGMKLAQFLFWEGAKLIVTDIDPKRCEQAKHELQAEIVSPDEILRVTCDILSPCALGGGINEKTIPSLRCKGIAGLANNQLLTQNDGIELMRRGILYAPDFVINSGGLINVALELEKGGYSPTSARDKIDRLYDVLLQIFSLSKERNLSTDAIAREIAEHNLAKSSE